MVFGSCIFGVSFVFGFLQVLARGAFAFSVPQSLSFASLREYSQRAAISKAQFVRASSIWRAMSQPPPNKALHPTAYSSVRFGRKLPSLSALPAAGELVVVCCSVFLDCPAQLCVQVLAQLNVLFPSQSLAASFLFRLSAFTQQITAPDRQQRHSIRLLTASLVRRCWRQVSSAFCRSARRR